MSLASMSKFSLPYDIANISIHLYALTRYSERPQLQLVKPEKLPWKFVSYAPISEEKITANAPTYTLRFGVTGVSSTSISSTVSSPSVWPLLPELQNEHDSVQRYKTTHALSSFPMCWSLDITTISMA